jgi:hypothetical protein
MTTFPADSARNACTASAERSLGVSVMAVLFAVWYEKDRRRLVRRHP